LEAPYNPSVQPGVSESDAIFRIYLNGDIFQPIEERHDRIRSNGEPCNSGSCTPYLNVEQTFTYPVTFGTPYDFQVEITARAVLNSYSGFSGRSTVDLGHTMTWGGIVSVTDSSGNPIADYTDTSASGTNYMVPIVPQCATPPTALAGWWPGDNHPRDIRNANNGTLENGATYSAGRVGQAFSFPGSGTRVHVPHAAVLDFNATQDYTIDFWMKAGAQSGSGSTLVEKNGGTYPYSVRLLPTGFVSAGFTDGTNPTSVTSTDTLGKVDNNLWHHIAVVFKHSTKLLELYIDGSLNASQPYNATLGPLTNGQDLYFGARSDSSNSFVGLLDEVDISSGALSLSEIQAIAAAADLGKCRPPVIATGVVSRKNHTNVGPFDVNLPLSGPSGIECRSGGATGDYQVVATFSGPVTVDGAIQAEVISGSGAVGSGGSPNGGVVAVNGSTVTIPLTNVANAQTLNVRLNTVSNGASTADVVVPMSVLIGDSTASRVVNSGDATQVRNRSGQDVNESTFRSDITTDGFINSGDATAVKSRSGTELP
jgi:hypothetical protein